LGQASNQNWSVKFNVQNHVMFRIPSALTAHWDLHSPELLALLTVISASEAHGNAEHRNAPTALPPSNLVSRQWHCQKDPEKVPNCMVEHSFVHMVSGITRRIVPALMMAIIMFESYAFYYIALPWYDLNLWSQTIVSAMFVAVVLTICQDYLLVCFRDPGKPTDVHFHELPSTKSIGWCQHCKEPKPARCHHCRWCSRCVLKMDHHCIFTNSCIGLKNYNNFARLLLSLIIGLCFPLVGLLPFVVTGISDWQQNTSSVLWWVALLALVVALCAMFLLTDLFLFHILLCLRNETTIEHLENWSNRQKNPYDEGVLANFIDIFGRPPACCLQHLESMLKVLRFICDPESG